MLKRFNTQRKFHRLCCGSHGLVLLREPFHRADGPGRFDRFVVERSTRGAGQRAAEEGEGEPGDPAIQPRPLQEHQQRHEAGDRREARQILWER